MPTSVQRNLCIDTASLNTDFAKCAKRFADPLAGFLCRIRLFCSKTSNTEYFSRPLAGRGADRIHITDFSSTVPGFWNLACDTWF